MMLKGLLPGENQMMMLQGTVVGVAYETVMDLNPIGGSLFWSDI